MNRDDEALEIAARIADGSAVDWPASHAGATTTGDRAVLDELKAIADLATLHRSPTNWSDDDTSVRPETWGPLTLLHPIGRGRFGDVYAAWDSRLQRRVALKLLLASSPSASASPTRAIDEARLLARVRHPNVLSVYGAECIDGQVGIWTEFIEGSTLESVLMDRGTLTTSEVLSVGSDLCRALTAVHAAGLLHRDIKAQNVMRETGGRIVLMDFGTGHDVTTAPAEAGDLSGTPLYLAPEIFTGDSASQQSDVYALAVLLFRLLTGAYPVKGRTLDEVRLGHQRDDRQRLVDLRPDVPVALASVIERGLAEDPARRYESALAFGAALERIATDTNESGESSGTRPRPEHLPQRSRLPLVWAAVWGGVVIGLVAVMTRPTLPVADQPGESIHPLRVVGPLPIARWESPISRDGRRIAFNDLDGNVWLWEPATGQRQQVTNKPPESLEGASGDLIVSPDGNRVAYMWFTSNQTYEVRVTSTTSTHPVVLYAASDPAEYPMPVEWSRDAMEILCLLQHEDGTVDLALIGVTGGPPRVLLTFRRGMPTHASLSPDRRWVVYDAPANDETGQRDLFVLSTDSAIVRELAPHPTNDSAPMWTPDGNCVFFISDRSGFPEGWIVPVRDGAATDEPVLVARNFRGVIPTGFTETGALHYWLDTSDLEIYRMAVDLSRAGLATPARRISPTVVGGHVGPTWSPDGRWLAYIARQPNVATYPTLNRGPNAITIQDEETGRAHDLQLHPQLASLQIAPPRWSPDERSLLVKGTDLDNQFGYFRVDVKTGAVSPLLLTGSPGDESRYGAGYWSADGKALLYRHSPRGIVARDLVTGAETVVVDRKQAKLRNFAHFGPSSDGRFVAIAGLTSGEPAFKVVMVQTIGGALHEVFRTTADEVLAFQAWTPDNRVVFTRLAQVKFLKNEAHELWTVSATGGDAHDTGIRIPGHPEHRYVSLSPNGRELAYTEGETRAEERVMEHFLPRP